MQYLVGSYILSILHASNVSVLLDWCLKIDGLQWHRLHSSLVKMGKNAIFNHNIITSSFFLLLSIHGQKSLLVKRLGRNTDVFCSFRFCFCLFVFVISWHIFKNIAYVFWDLDIKNISIKLTLRGGGGCTCNSATYTSLHTLDCGEVVNRGDRKSVV